MKQTYAIRVTEYLQRVVRVKAESEAEAIRIAEDAYDCANLVLYPEDSQGAEYFSLGLANGAHTGTEVIDKDYFGKEEEA